jgi:hypothetical protein
MGMSNDQKFELVRDLIKNDWTLQEVLVGVREIDKHLFSAITVENDGQSISINIPLALTAPLT